MILNQSNPRVLNIIIIGIFSVVLLSCERLSSKVLTRDDIPSVINHPPEAISGVVATEMNQAVPVTLVATDGDGQTLSYHVENQPVHGSLQNVPPFLIYTPHQGFSGIDEITFRASDGIATSELARVQIIVTALTPAGTYVVDAQHPNASDSNPGTEILPFRTIQRAANRVNPGDTVLIKPGLYSERVVMTRSGTSNRRITFRAYDGSRKPIITGDRIRVNCVECDASYTTLDGLDCKNFVNGSGSAGFNFYGTTDTVIRNSHIFMEYRNTERPAGDESDLWYLHDDLGSESPAPGERMRHLHQDEVTGIFATGPNQNLLIEQNHIHYMGGGIGARWRPGAGYTNGIVIRNNWVHDTIVSSHREQNNFVGIGLSNMTAHALIQGNVVIKSSDSNIQLNEMSGPAVIEDNIVAMANWVNGGGGGDGIKIKPLSDVAPDGTLMGSPFADIVVRNISFLNQGFGIHLIVLQFGWGHRAFYNTSANNCVSGMSYGTFEGSPELVTEVRSNIFSGNINRDFEPHTQSPREAIDFNFVEDGWWYGGNVPVPEHSIYGRPMRYVNSAGSDLSALNFCVNEADVTMRTPPALEPLSNPDAFPDALSAIAYAKNLVDDAFRPKLTSGTLDAGKDDTPSLRLSVARFPTQFPYDFGHLEPSGLRDLFMVAPWDRPDIPNPWPGVEGAGVYDMGAIEWGP